MRKLTLFIALFLFCAGLTNAAVITQSADSINFEDSSKTMVVTVAYNCVGARQFNVTVPAGSGYTIDFTTGAVDRTCTLPTLADNIGRVIWISKVDSGAGKVIVACEGADTFLDTDTSKDLDFQGDTLAIKGSTNGWKVF